MYFTSTVEEQDEEEEEENPAGLQEEKEKAQKGKKKNGKRVLAEAIDFTHLQGLREPHADAILSAISIRSSQRSLKSRDFEAVKAQVGVRLGCCRRCSKPGSKRLVVRKSYCTTHTRPAATAATHTHVPSCPSTCCVVLHIGARS